MKPIEILFLSCNRPARYAEYFDVLNHTELANPNTTNPTASSTSFGTITSTSGGPRIAQFSLKFSF